MKKYNFLLAITFFAFNILSAQTPVWIRQSQPDGNPCLGVSFSNDGTKIVSGSECPDARVRIWDASSGNMLYENIDTLMECYMGTAFSSNGMYFALIEETGILSVYDYMGATPQLLYNLDTETGAAYSVAFSPDNTKIVTGGDNDSVYVYNVMNGTELLALAGHNANVLAVAYSPNGNFIGSADEAGKIKIWNSTTGALISTINAHNSAINAIKFSPDNAYITSCADDHMIHTFNVSTGSMSGMIHEHTSAVNQIDITPNQQYLISVGNDKTIRIFDFSSGTELKTIDESARGTQNSISISQDNNSFVVGTGNGSVVLWHLDEVLGIHKIDGISLKAIISPNPTCDYLNISLKNIDNILEKTKISLFNCYGQEVMEIYQGTLQQNMTFTEDIKHLSNGNYQLRITLNNKINTYNLIINK